ncbi:MAG TPA: alpha/beta hydrolase-fold protein [Bacteroidota bacterium]|nr:alpha/beta hydrolase-fold protein [Bacteroidota bacterium]
MNMIARRIRDLVHQCALLGLIFLSSAPLYPQSTEALPPVVPIAGTQLLHLTSSIVNQEYDLYINLPRGYSDTTKRFPVIYHLDAQWDFPLVQSIYGQQYFDGFLPAAIVVGITWGGMNPNHDSLRARDLTPTNSRQQPQSGGGQKFLKAIKTEVIPFIDSRFRTLPQDRTLMGSSLGGLFTLFAMFQEPGLFNRYVLTSPSIGWDNGFLYRLEKEYASTHSNLQARLYVGIGGFEVTSLAEFDKFISVLKARSYPGLDMNTQVIQGVGHSGGKAEGYTRGLQAVFAKPAVGLSPEVLKSYIGKYRVGGLAIIEATEEKGGVTIVMPGNLKIPLLAESKDHFYVKGMFLLVNFTRGKEGQISGLELDMYNGKQVAERIN